MAKSVSSVGKVSKQELIKKAGFVDDYIHQNVTQMTKKGMMPFKFGSLNLSDDSSHCDFEKLEQPHKREHVTKIKTDTCTSNVACEGSILILLVRVMVSRLQNFQ